MKYFDHTSTTAVNPEVLETYYQVLKKYYVNSEAIYPEGMEVNRLMEKSRASIANFLAVRPNEIIFTSGGSEANNLAIKGTALKRSHLGKHIITSKVEHSSVLNSCKWLQDYFGFEVTYLDVNREGIIDTEQLKRALRDDTILVSLIYVNNESGAINPIEEIKKIVKARRNCYLHLDCVQAFGKMDIDLTDVDMASFSAHKINGLKGSGFLVRKQHVEIAELISAGQQEQHLRGGTANSPANIVLAKTVRLIYEAKKERLSHVIELHDYLYQKLQNLDSVVLNSPFNGTPFLINFSCLKITSQVMMNALAERGFEVSAQSTCDSQMAVSNVIRQMYSEPERLKGTIRVALSYDTSKNDVDELIAAIREIIEHYG